MGTCLLLQTNRKTRKPNPCSFSSDGKDLFDVLQWDIDGFITAIEIRHEIFLEPLKKIDGVDSKRKDMPQRALAAWQTIDDLIGALRCVLTFLKRAAPSDFRALEGFRREALKRKDSVYFRGGFNHAYFAKGGFREDLAELLQMTEWEKKHGATKVQLFGA